MMLIVFFSATLEEVISIPFIFCKLFHYVCLKHIQGFGKTKARTKTNQIPQYVVLEFTKKGKKRKRSRMGIEQSSRKKLSSTELLADVQLTQQRFSSASPVLSSPARSRPPLPQVPALSRSTTQPVAGFFPWSTCICLRSAGETKVWRATQGLLQLPALLQNRTPSARALLTVPGERSAEGKIGHGKSSLQREKNGEEKRKQICMRRTLLPVRFQFELCSLEL